MKKKYLLFLLTGFSTLLSTKAYGFFEDVDVTHPYYFSIRELYDNRIIEGYVHKDQTYYRPLNPISRVAALKILLLASNTSVDKNTTTDFPDIFSSEWYSPYVTTAYHNNIVSGFRDGYFYPAAEVSRAQMLKMSFLAFGATLPAEEEASNWYDIYMDFAKDFNIIDTKATPHAQLSRGEVAEIIYRTKKVAEKGYKEPYKYSGFGLASYYAGTFHGRTTASGEIYDKNDLTAAHRTLPFGTRLKISYQDKSVIVRINDRGPYHRNRIIDLSEGAFKKLSHAGAGVLPIGFELYSDSGSGKKAVPEYLREELQPQALNLAVPNIVRDHINKGIENPVRPRGNYIDGSVSRLPIDFFPNVTLYKSFPQKVYEGDVLFLSGRTKVSSPKRIKAFLQPTGTTEYEYMDVSGALSGNVFQLPLSFLHEGTYHLGIVVDDEQKSRVETITVLPRPQKEYYGTGKPLSTKQIVITMDPDTLEAKIPLGDPVKNPNIIYKVLMHQSEKTYDFRIEGGVKVLHLPQNLFSIFQPADHVFFDIYESVATDGILSAQSGSWKQTHKSSYALTPLFPDRSTDDITLLNFSSFLHESSDLVLRGRRNSSKRLHEYAYITKKGDFVKKISIDFDGEQYFSLPLSFDGNGTYVVELVSDQGEILFNKALYVYPEEVLPVLPWQEKLTVHPSKASMKYWINSIRAKYRRQGIIVDDVLTNFAQEYAEQMADKRFISHTDLQGNHFEDRVKNFGLKGEYGENLSYGSTLDLALNGLENSGSHLENMIAPYWKTVGIGYAKTPLGEYYLSHVFGR